LKFDLVVAIFPNLVANDYKSHVVVSGLVTFWLISTSDSTYLFTYLFWPTYLPRLTYLPRYLFLSIFGQNSISMTYGEFYCAACYD